MRSSSNISLQGHKKKKTYLCSYTCLPYLLFAPVRMHVFLNSACSLYFDACDRCITVHWRNCRGLDGHSRWRIQWSYWQHLTWPESRLVCVRTATACTRSCSGTWLKLGCWIWGSAPSPKHPKHPCWGRATAIAMDQLQVKSLNIVQKIWLLHLVQCCGHQGSIIVLVELLDSTICVAVCQLHHSNCHILRLRGVLPKVFPDPFPKTSAISSHHLECEHSLSQNDAAWCFWKLAKETKIKTFFATKLFLRQKSCKFFGSPQVCAATVTATGTSWSHHFRLRGHLQHFLEIFHQNWPYKSWTSLAAWSADLYKSAQLRPRSALQWSDNGPVLGRLRLKTWRSSPKKRPRPQGSTCWQG